MQLLKIEQEKPSKYLNKQDVSKILEPVVVFVKHRENASDFVTKVAEVQVKDKKRSHAQLVT